MTEPVGGAVVFGSTSFEDRQNWNGEQCFRTRQASDVVGPTAPLAVDMTAVHIVEVDRIVQATWYMERSARPRRPGIPRPEGTLLSLFSWGYPPSEIESGGQGMVQPMERVPISVCHTPPAESSVAAGDSALFSRLSGELFECPGPYRETGPYHHCTEIRGGSPIYLCRGSDPGPGFKAVLFSERPDSEGVGFSAQ